MTDMSASNEIITERGGQQLPDEKILAGRRLAFRRKAV